MPTSQIVFCFFTILLTTGFVRGDEAHLKCFPTSIGEIVEIDIRINGKILSVSHIARNGVAYERMSQYHVYYSGSDKGLIWEGIHSRKQDLKMVGRLDGFSPTTQATYTEDLINANTGLLNQTKALCPALRKEQEVATSASAMVEAPEQLSLVPIRPCRHLPQLTIQPAKKHSPKLRRQNNAWAQNLQTELLRHSHWRRLRKVRMALKRKALRPTPPYYPRPKFQRRRKKQQIAVLAFLCWRHFCLLWRSIFSLSSLHTQEDICLPRQFL